MSISRRRFLKRLRSPPPVSPCRDGRRKRLGEQMSPMPRGRSSPPGTRSHSTRPPTGSETPSSESGPTGGRNASPSRATGTGASCIRRASHDYQYQCAHYGHPSKAGFKEVIHAWRAENWDPEHLIGLYKKAGAKYFMCLANHHDNFDNLRLDLSALEQCCARAEKRLGGRLGEGGTGGGSSVRGLGPRRPCVVVVRDLSGRGYERPAGGRAVRRAFDEGGRQRAMVGRTGPAGSLRAEPRADGARWDWNNKGRGDLPSQAYCEKFFNRTIELIDKYHPGPSLFRRLPSSRSADQRRGPADRRAFLQYATCIGIGGKLEAVINGKILNEQQRKCMVLGLRARNQRPHRAVAVADRHVYRQLALRHQYVPAAWRTKRPIRWRICWWTSSAKTAT